MAWIKAANGNVFEVEDTDHVAKILRESPIDDSGKPLCTAWESDPREKGAKRWKADAADAAEADSE